MDPRLASAVAAGKVATTLSRRLRVGGGTTLPGTLATRLDPALIAKLTRTLPGGAMLVTGTNGKTTTARLIAAALERDGRRVVHNRAGANLVGGVASALVGSCDWLARPAGDVALFEVDEATLPRVIADIRPRVVTITNLFRDQLDRYGEIDYVARLWRGALVQLGPDATVVLNADDPLVAHLGANLVARVLYFGIDDPSAAQPALDHAADSTSCPACGAPLDYLRTYYSHLGDYCCARCAWRRPDRAFAAARIEARGFAGSDVELRGPAGRLTLTVPLPGHYNVYNALAAIAASFAAGVDPAAAAAATQDAPAAFGRVERVSIEGRTFFLALIKNPVGCNQVLRTILDQPGEHDLVILINDGLADGTDISWLWDADFERLAGRCRSAVVGGTRGADMLVRLKYAGVDPDHVTIAPSIPAAIGLGRERVPVGGTVFVLPTYTAMIELHNYLSRQSYARSFWKD